MTIKSFRDFGGIMFSNMRLMRALLFLYAGLSISLSALLLCMSYLFVSSVGVNQGVELILVPITSDVKGSR